MKLPRVNELADLVKAVKTLIEDDSRAHEEAERPSVLLTVGCDVSDGSWGYQTGDNSFMGDAYFYPHWGVVDVYRNSNSVELAREIRRQIKEATW